MHIQGNFFDRYQKAPMAVTSPISLKNDARKDRELNLIGNDHFYLVSEI